MARSSRHPHEVRERAVALVVVLSSVVVLVQDLRVSESCLRRWVAQADTDERGSQP